MQQRAFLYHVFSYSQLKSVTDFWKSCRKTKKTYEATLNLRCLLTDRGARGHQIAMATGGQRSFRAVKRFSTVKNKKL